MVVDKQSCKIVIKEHPQFSATTECHMIEVIYQDLICVVTNVGIRLKDEFSWTCPKRFYMYQAKEFVDKLPNELYLELPIIPETNKKGKNIIN